MTIKRNRATGVMAMMVLASLASPMLSSSVEAKTLYVDPNGNDSVTYAENDSTHPWQTIGRAAWGSTDRLLPNSLQAAQPGDTVIVRAGTYITPGTYSRFTPSLNPVNNGRVNNGTEERIVFRSETIGGATIQPQITHTGTVRSAGNNYPEGGGGFVQLADNASSVDDFYSGGFIRITSGRGAGQVRLVALPQSGINAYLAGSYIGATKTARTQTPWDIDAIPDATSQYQYVTPGPLIGTLNKQYVTWDGFRIVEGDSYSADTGPVVVWSSQNIVLQNLEIIGTNPPTHFDNHNGIRLEYTADILIRNNTIRGFNPSAPGFNNSQNAAGVMTYHTNNIVVENNVLHDVASGFFPKGGDGTSHGHIYRYNKIYNCQKAFRVSYHTDISIHQNVIEDCDYAFQPAENISNIRFYNNTIANSPWGIYNWFPATGFDLYNNIYYNLAHPHRWDDAVPAGSFASSHNNYFNYTSFFNGGNRTIEQWQTLGYDVTGTVLADPLFINASSGDYRLQSGSPVVDAGRNNQTMGAYITGNEVIGPANIENPPVPPSPPRNLRRVL